MKYYQCLLFSSLTACFINSYADLPLPPRLTLDGLASNTAVIAGDGLLPLSGDSQHLFFADLQSKTGFQQNWTASGGFGYRQLGHDRLQGAYLFVDRNQAASHHTFWVLSPGLESLGKHWDFRSNLYWPIGKQKTFVQQDFADNFGNYSQVSFQGHTQYDVLADLYQSIHAGADAEISYLIPTLQGTVLHVGGYYFTQSDHPNIQGVISYVTYPIDPHVALTWGDSYDNVQHNRLMTGLQFTLGGTGASDKDRSNIAERITDPIERQLATKTQGNAIPIENQLILQTQTQVEKTNIWFFQNGATPHDTDINANSCTFEHPCNGFTQQQLNAIAAIAPNANFYFAPGNYNALNDQDPLQLQAGQSFYGRSADYKSPAETQEKPVFIGAFTMANHTALHNIVIINSDAVPQYQGILIRNVSDIDLNDVQIGSLGPTQSGAFSTGIYVTGNNVQLTIVNSQINAFAVNRNNSPVYGIQINKANNDQIAIINSQITAIDNSNSDIDYAQGLALSGSNNNIFTIDHSTITAQAIAQNGMAMTYGIFASLRSTNQLNIKNSLIQSFSQSNINDSKTFGIYWSDANNNQVFIDHSQLRSTAITRYGFGAANTRTFYVYDNGNNDNVTIQQSNLNAMAAAAKGTATAYDLDMDTALLPHLIDTTLTGSASANDPNNAIYAPFSNA